MFVRPIGDPAVHRSLGPLFHTACLSPLRSPTRRPPLPPFEPRSFPDVESGRRSLFDSDVLLPSFRLICIRTSHTETSWIRWLRCWRREISQRMKGRTTERTSTLPIEPKFDKRKNGCSRARENDRTTRRILSSQSDIATNHLSFSILSLSLPLPLSLYLSLSFSLPFTFSLSVLYIESVLCRDPRASQTE